MARTRWKNSTWTIDQSVTSVTWDAITALVLQDIRDELQKLNSLLHCPNFIGIPGVLRTIAANTKPKKPKRRRKAVTSPGRGGR